MTDGFTSKRLIFKLGIPEGKGKKMQFEQKLSSYWKT